jgi:AraC-like DNA-binding protein
MAISPVHLRRVFKQVTGLAPGQFVTKTRLDAAAQLLRVTSMPIKAIAAEAAIGNPAYFSRLFQRQYGIAPAAYRKEAQLL